MKTKYVVKGLVDDSYSEETVAYFTRVEEQIIWNNKPFDVRVCSEVIEGATFYDSYQDALDTIREYSLHNFEPYPVCPICNRDYSEHPAISRNDNKTEICPNCGMQEALNIFKEFKKNATN